MMSCAWQIWKSLYGKSGIYKTIVFLLLMSICLSGCSSVYGETQSIDWENKIPDETLSAIDYECLERDGYELLNSNICVNPKSVYEDLWLCEQEPLKGEIIRTKEYELSKGPCLLEYFLFDLDDDSEEEYIVSFAGGCWTESVEGWGNQVWIFDKTENGLKEIYTNHRGYLYSYDSEIAYWPIAVLKQKTGGYHDIVMPWASDKNGIWKYDSKKEEYSFEKLQSAERLSNEIAPSSILYEKNEKGKFLPDKMMEYEPIDYAAIEQEGHKVLNKNICTNPESIYEDPWLCGQIPLKWYIELSEKYEELHGTVRMEYFCFDLNDDGTEEYIVSFAGEGWTDDEGGTVWIFRKTEDGIEKIYEGAGLYSYAKGIDYWPICVLNEKTNGYYDIVLPWNQSCILKYNEEKEAYSGEVIKEYEENNEWKLVEEAGAIDYVKLEKEGHTVLEKNICRNPESIYKDSWLCEQEPLKRDIIYTEKTTMRSMGSMEYFLFDLNDDGTEEYIVSFHAGVWAGSGGNSVRIYRKSGDGLEEIYNVTARLYAYSASLEDKYPLSYWPMAVLQEKTDGYHDFVLPWGDNLIWKYNEEKGVYEG